ncbi:hypothetical protein AMTRI_Chr01g135790 [Amborella trichopoda]
MYQEDRFCVHDEEDGGQSFFKIMLGNFSKQLFIPPAFRHNFKKRFHEAVLEGPSGNNWNVEVEEVRGALCFSRGWKKFVKDHSLNDGDFLVFYYDGDTHFLIKIFNKTGCEREDAFDVECFEKHSPVEKNMPECPLAIVEASENPLCIAEKQWSPKKWHRTYTSTTSPVTEQQKEEAIQKAQSFRTNCPHFVVPMRCSLVSTAFMVTIPQKFLALKVLTKGQDITLQVPKVKNSWHAKMTWTRGVTRISSGWKKFVTSNNLKDGDACVFALSRARNDTFNIHIFRA